MRGRFALIGHIASARHAQRARLPGQPVQMCVQAPTGFWASRQPGIQVIQPHFARR